MAIFTEMSTFKTITLTVAKNCAGCGKPHRIGAEVQAKFYRDKSAWTNVGTIVLCKDSRDCWEEWDWKYWGEKTAPESPNFQIG